MTTVKWIFVVLFGVGSAGALGMALTAGGIARPPVERTAPAISLRQFPTMVASVGTPRAPDVAAPVAATPCRN